MLFIAIAPCAAHAQNPLPTVDDWNTKALASGCVMLSAALAYSVRYIFGLYDRLILREVEAAKQAREDRTEAMDLSKLVLTSLHGDEK